MYTGQHNTEKRGHKFMPRAGFESTIPMLERFYNIRALHSEASGIVTKTK